MFNDVLTSGKGPGIIGILLALLVLAGFSGLGMAVFNGLGAGGEAITQETIDQQVLRLNEMDQSIEEQKAILNAHRVWRNKAEEIPYEAKKVEQAKALLESAKNGVLVGQKEVDQVFNGWERYKARYRKNERSLMRGQYVDLSETLGNDFKKVRVSKVTPTGIRILLESGPRGIAYQELPKGLRDRLQFDADEAKLYKKALAVTAKKLAEGEKEWNKRQAEEQVAAEAAKKANQIARLRRGIQNAEQAIIRKQQQAASHRKDAQRWKKQVAKAKAAGRFSMAQGKVTQAEEKEKAAEKAITALQAKIRQMNQQLRELAQ